MTYTETMENSVLTKVSEEFNNCESKDQVNKIYRQARIWVRFHCHFAKACSVEHSQELNQKLKVLRWDRLKELGDNENED